MFLKLALNLRTSVTQVARLARDLWQLVNDVWELEERKWEDIVKLGEYYGKINRTNHCQQL